MTGKYIKCSYDQCCNYIYRSEHDLVLQDNHYCCLEHYRLDQRLLTPEEEEELLCLYGEKWKTRDIADHFGISPAYALRTYRRKAGKGARKIRQKQNQETVKALMGRKFGQLTCIDSFIINNASNLFLDVEIYCQCECGEISKKPYRLIYQATKRKSGRLDCPSCNKRPSRKK